METDSDEDRPREKNKGGRPPGSLNRLAREAREKAQATGKLPHEILLSMARGEPQPNPIVDPKTGKVIDTAWLVADFEQRKDAAKAAAPYYAPRIQSVEIAHGMTDDALDSIIAQLAAETGISVSPGGEGTQATSQGSAPTGRRVWSDDDEDADGD